MIDVNAAVVRNRVIALTRGDVPEDELDSLIEEGRKLIENLIHYPTRGSRLKYVEDDLAMTCSRLWSYRMNGRRPS